MNFSPQRVLFEPLELSGTSWTRWAGSLVIHTVAIVILIAIPVTIHQAAEAHRQPYVVNLVDPVRPSATPAPRVIVHIAPVPPVSPPAPKVRFKAPETPPPAPKVVAIKALPSIELPKPPGLATLEAPKIELAGPRPVVKENVFPASTPTPAAPAASARPVKTGGFGNPDGARSSSSSTGTLAPQVGAFDLAAGSSHGAGNDSSGSNGGNGKRVAMAGFGGPVSGAGTGSAGDSRGQVRSAGFGQYPVAAATQPRAVTPAAPADTPVEITFKPKPSYTPEAREKRIEGEVLLEVLFSATGEIRVLALNRGLGYGLDEKARDAASQIRFRPGTRAGNPIDVKGVVHIVFELS
jgi:TonB family protein